MKTSFEMCVHANSNIIIIIIIIIYLFIKHIHTDGRKQESGTGQQGTHSTLTVGLHM